METRIEIPELDSYYWVGCYYFLVVGLSNKCFKGDALHFQRISELYSAWITSLSLGDKKKCYFHFQNWEI